MSRSARVAALAVAVLSTGCARSLREPPDLADLAPVGPRVSAAEAWEMAGRAEKLYEEREPRSVLDAALLWTRAAQSVEGRREWVVGAVRARVWLADHVSDPRERREQAVAAVQTAQWCPGGPSEPECAYWLAVALGVQARERRSTALDALRRIEGLFQRAADGAPELDAAGPDRALALLYLRAPGWPSGPGDPDRGLKHALKAVELRPDFPPNQLALGEALAEVGEAERSRRTYERALELARAWRPPEAEEWIRAAQQALRRF